MPTKPILSALRIFTETDLVFTTRCSLFPLVRQRLTRVTDSEN
jgi:hypothetical protein